MAVALCWLLAHATTASIIASAGCGGAADCSLNGDCSSLTGECHCGQGWQGTDCRELRLLPAAPPTAQAYCHFNHSTWGASVLRDDAGTYHMYFSEMANNCSLRDYGRVSRIVHAVADNAEGPFVRQDVALPVFAHNPMVVRHPDGTYLLYHIGDDIEPKCVLDCQRVGDVWETKTQSRHVFGVTSGQPPLASPSPTPPCGQKSHGTSIAYATSPAGPWTRMPYVLDKYTNPAPYIFSNGSVLLAARKEGIHIFRADSWRGPYKHVTRIGAYEDPFLWRDGRGFHLLSHDRLFAEDLWYDDHGGYWSSSDGLHWAGPAESAYNTTVTWAAVPLGAPTNKTLSARQRPFLFFDPSGDTFLYTGVGLPGKSHWDFSCTFVQRVDPGPDVSLLV